MPRKKKKLFHLRKQNKLPPLFHSYKKLMIFFLFLCLFFFLGINILFSQISSEIPDFKTNDLVFLVNYWKKIINLPIAQEEKEKIEKTLPVQVTEIISQKKTKVLEEIKKKEKALSIIPKSRDLFLELASLYEEIGNLEKAKEYKEKAQEIDPRVK